MKATFPARWSSNGYRSLTLAANARKPPPVSGTEKQGRNETRASRLPLVVIVVAPFGLCCGQLEDRLAPEVQLMALVDPSGASSPRPRGEVKYRRSGSRNPGATQAHSTPRE